MGDSIDWLALYSTDRPRRIALPGYPFARESYWFTTRAEEFPQQLPLEPQQLPAARERERVPVAHPLLGKRQR
jgi:acyl transferase domain-containing protein